MSSSEENKKHGLSEHAYSLMLETPYQVLTLFFTWAYRLIIALALIAFVLISYIAYDELHTPQEVSIDSSR